MTSTGCINKPDFDINRLCIAPTMRQCTPDNDPLFITLRPRQNGCHFVDDIFKCIFLNAKYEFRLRFHWRLFLGVQLTIFQHWFQWWLGTDQMTSHHLNQWGLVYWYLYVSPGLSELMGQLYHEQSSLDTCLGQFLEIIHLGHLYPLYHEGPVFTVYMIRSWRTM